LIFIRDIKAKEKIILPENRKADTVTEKTVLDFGCGAGKNLLALRAEHTKWKLYGFDISANKEVITIGNDISIIYDDINKLKDSFNHEYFDIIYMNNVLEHLSDPIQTLKDLKHLLKNDGTIIIEVPNIDSIKFKIFGKYFSSLDIPRHLYDFSPKTLSIICEKSGLKIKSFTLNGSTKSTLRSIYYMFGIYKKDLNRILFKIISVLTKMIGEKNINEDVIVAVVFKS
jgi:2-polyprenyl-3-methyl-5-hydroxy-6-metoxy-1,4-benzoquinol methylase